MKNDGAETETTKCQSKLSEGLDPALEGLTWMASGDSFFVLGFEDDQGKRRGAASILKLSNGRWDWIVLHQYQGDAPSKHEAMKAAEDVYIDWKKRVGA